MADALEGEDPRLARRLRAREFPDVRTIDGDPRKTFAVIGAGRETEEKRHLVVVMPGGNGPLGVLGQVGAVPWLILLSPSHFALQPKMSSNLLVDS